MRERSAAVAGQYQPNQAEQDPELAFGQERHAQIIQRHDLLDLVGMLLGEIHRDVAAHRMADHRHLGVVGVRLDLLHLAEGEMDVVDAALNLRQAADIEFAGLGHHRRIGRQIVLRADRQIAARGEDVGEERILGVLDGVAVIEHRHRQRDHAGIGLHFLVPPHGDHPPGPDGCRARHHRMSRSHAGSPTCWR